MLSSDLVEQLAESVASDLAAVAGASRSLEAVLAASHARVADLEAQLEAKTARIAELEALLRPATRYRTDFDADPVASWKPGMNHKPENRPVSGGRVHAFAPAAPAGTGYQYGFDVRAMLDGLGLPECDEAWLRYGVVFPKTWDPFRGGKLPGLGGLSGGLTIGTMPGGGEYDPRGFSARLMWKPSTGITPARNDRARLCTYFYVPKMAGKLLEDNRNPPPPQGNGRMYGIQIHAVPNPDPAKPVWGWWPSGYLYLLLDEVNDVAVHLRLNEPGVDDGLAEVFLNGVKGVDMRNVMYRDAQHPDLRINLLSFGSFYGGPSANTTDQRWEFDYLEVETV